MFTSLILKIFVPDYGKNLTVQVRTQCGIVAGVTGIVCNVLLAIIKLVLAITAGSIAMAADAVNNISDAGAGVITVSGFYLANRPPDEEHPFGHGRTEYIAGLVVALLVVGLGISFFKDSVVALFKPSAVHADKITVIIFSCTILIKCWMFLFYHKIGKLINSDVIKASAYDSLSDCIGTAIVVVSLISSNYTSFPVDGCAGAVVAVMVLYAGISIFKDIVSKLLGETPDSQLVEKIRQTLISCPGIDGVHDIMIHNYGENAYFVTAHAEIASDGDFVTVHDILENAEVVAAKELSINLQLHGDPYDKHNPETVYWRSRLENAVAAFDSEFKVYDFKLEHQSSDDSERLYCHLLIPHKYRMSEVEILEELQKRMRKHKDSIQLDIRFVKSFV